MTLPFLFWGASRWQTLGYLQTGASMMSMIEKRKSGEMVDAIKSFICAYDFIIENGKSED